MLDETIADADRVGPLSLKRAGCSHQSLVKLDHRRSDGLTVGPSRCLMDMLEGRVGLIAVSWAELPKDGVADLLIP